MTTDHRPSPGRALKKLQPADLYMTLLLAKLAKKPVEKVADEYEESRGEGWGVITKRMGIKPGSPEFHEMKHRVKGHKKKKGRRDKNDDDDDDDDLKSRGRGRGNRGR